MSKTDFENVIKEINDGILFAESRGYGGIADTMKKSLSLLKEQEAVEPINSYGTFRCGNCRNIVGYNDGHGHGYQNNFCSKCGKAAKWI